MATKGKKRRKGKVRIKQKASVRRKDSVNVDSLPKMKTQMPRTNGAVLKVKLKHK